MSHAIELEARQAAVGTGLIAYKSGWRAGTKDNLGGFRLFDPDCNAPVHGLRFELTAEQVIELCSAYS